MLYKLLPYGSIDEKHAESLPKDLFKATNEFKWFICALSTDNNNINNWFLAFLFILV